MFQGLLSCLGCPWSGGKGRWAWEETEVEVGKQLGNNSMAKSIDALSTTLAAPVESAAAYTPSWPTCHTPLSPT